MSLKKKNIEKISNDNKSRRYMIESNEFEKEFVLFKNKDNVGKKNIIRKNVNQCALSRKRLSIFKKIM